MDNKLPIAKQAGMAAAGAIALAAAILWIPYWPVQLLLAIGAAVFVFVLLRDPAYFFMRMAGLCLGAATGFGSLPAIKAGFGLPDGTWAAIVLDSSPWIAVALVGMGVVALVCELVIRKGWPDRAETLPAGTHSTATSSGAGSAVAAPVHINGSGNFSPGVSDATVRELLKKVPDAAPQAAADSVAPKAGPSTIPALNQTIVARPAIIDDIHAALVARDATGAIKQAATTAHGGFGKTVAALLYAHQFERFYTGGRFFLPMENADFAVRLAEQALALKLEVPNEPEAAAALVKAAIENACDGDNNPAPSLLILDNITGEDQWKAILNSGLLPRGECRVLLTTRAEKLAKTTPIKVGPLTHEQARDVYRKFCAGVRPAPDDATADAITDWLTGLAVAVAAVAARMRLVPGDTWTQYANTLRTLRIKDYPDKSDRARAEMGFGDEELPESRRTARVIDDALDALAPHEQRAIHYAALLPEDMAPKVWLQTLVTTDAARAATDENGTRDALALAVPPDDLDSAAPGERAVAHLIALDLLSAADETGNLLSLHRLWHARVNQKAEDDKTDRTPLLLAIAACAAARRDVIIGTHPDGTDRGVDNPAALTDQSLRWELTPLAEVCTGLWAAGRVGAAAGLGVWLASVLGHFGRFAEAAACLQLSDKTDAAVEAAIGHRDLAAAFSNLATIQKAQGDLPGARASMEQAIAIQSKHFAPDHPTFATSYSNLATIQQAQGDLPGARASMEQAIAIQSKHFAPDHPTFAIRYSNLATIQQDQGDLPGARASMEKAIAIESKHFAPDHPTLAISYSNLALIQQAQGDPPGARASMEQAIAIWSKHLVADHPNFGSAYSNLAMIQQDQGDLPGARASMEQAIAIDSKHFAPDHPKLGIRYINLAGICYHEGDRAAACANFKKALTILLKHFDENHPHVKTVRKWMNAAGCTP